MRIPLLEGERGALPFIVNRSAPFVTESRNGISFTRIPGRFSVCDSVNGNNRRYPKKVWEKNLAEGSTLKESIKKNAAFGLLEHPSDGKISLLSPICILVTDAKMASGDDGTGKSINEVVGELIVIPGMPEGQRLKALIDVGYNPLVSSRGFGSVVKTSEGIDEVQDDYVCEGWDVVLRPSFENAELFVPRDQEGKAEAKEKPPEKSLAESDPAKQEAYAYGTKKCPKCGHECGVSLKTKGDKEKGGHSTVSWQCGNKECSEHGKEKTETTAQENLKAASSPSQAAAPVAEAKPKLTVNAMTINEIKSRIGQVRALGVPRDPGQFAEGMNEMGQLHQEIANFVAEDAKRGWQGQQLHTELSRIESNWSANLQAPSKAAAKLNENYSKVLKVTKVLGEAAVKIRSKLAEALSQNAEAAQLIEELAERGQAWVAVADKRKSKLEDFTHKLEVACEALDIMRDRYNEDMTDMGRRVITLEFAEKAQTEEIQKKLKEAKLPQDIIAIREELDPKSKEKPVQEGKDGKTPKTESKDDKTPKAPAPKAESKEPKNDFEGLHVLVPSVRTVTESVAIAQRLSASRLTEAEKREQKANAETPAK